MPKKDVSRRAFLRQAATASGAAVLAGCASQAPEGAPKPLNVRYGLNLLVYTAAFTKNDVGLISKVADFGYDGVEILFGDLSILDPKATRRACEKAGVAATACCVLVPEANIVSTEAAVRERGVARLKQMVDLTAEMGGNVMAGPLYAPVRYLTGRAPTDDEWRWCAEGLWAAAEHAQKASVALAIEPLNRFETYVVTTSADAIRLIQEVGARTSCCRSTRSMRTSRRRTRRRRSVRRAGTWGTSTPPRATAASRAPARCAGLKCSGRSRRSATTAG